MPGSPFVYGRRVSEGSNVEKHLDPSDNRSPCGVRCRKGGNGHVRSPQTQRGKDCLLNTRGRRDLARGKPMTHRENEKGQSLLEYAMVAAVVAAAVIAMSTYVFRSVQATQQMIQTEFQKE